jgi:hypothetical protein
MRCITRVFCFSILLAAVFALRSSGQSGLYPPRPPFTGYDVLLLSESVQQELKLTTEQLRQVKEFVRDTRIRRGGEFEKNRYPTEERADKAKGMLRAISDDTLQGVAAYLKPEQLQRLKQIRIQWNGLQAFFEPETQALGLTAAQKQELEKIGQWLKESMSKAVQDPSKRNLQAKLDAMGGLRRQAMARAVALLSQDQKKTWHQLVGEPFQPSSPSPPGQPDRRKEPVPSGSSPRLQAGSFLTAVPARLG